MGVLRGEDSERKLDTVGMKGNKKRKYRKEQSVGKGGVGRKIQNKK